MLRSQLFEGWITLPTGKIAIQRISVDLISVEKTNHALHWLVVYPGDSVIHLSSNPELKTCLFICFFVCCVAAGDSFSLLEKAQVVLEQTIGRIKKIDNLAIGDIVLMYGLVLSD